MIELRINDRGNIEKNAVDMHSEFPKMHTKEGKWKISKYQPDELSLMPERGADKESISYDRVLDYEIQAQADKDNKGVSAHTIPGSKMLDKVQKSKPTVSSSDRKKTVGSIRRGKTSKPSPLDEARARAERLRNYKADLQKMKKEKEEEDIKRLEALKKERQKRIAARSSSVTRITTKSTMPSKQTKKQFPTKILPSSKFSDSEPRSSLPFQRFPIRVASGGSNDSSKASKTSRLNTGSHSVTSKVRKSVPILPEPKQEKGDGATNTKASITRIRRSSEPKMNVIRPTSLVKPRSSRTMSKTKAADESETRKISAIVNYDKDKIATLPELKIRISKATGNVKDRSSIKDKTQKLNGDKPSKSSEGALLKKSEIGISSTFIEFGFDVQSDVKVNNAEKEASKSSSTCVTEETRAPYSRGSSLEGRSTRNSEYGKEPPMSLETTSIGTETFRGHLSDTRWSTLEKIPEVNENPQVKESPKGIRRLLKFGKKNHNSVAGRNMESDCANIDGSEANENGANCSSSEVPTLKNLLSRDETLSNNATPQKSTRSFSLLSPFRSNSREKKIMMA